ncbi:MAG TPA: 50S ribosomal protein L11 methyltransferase [Candidatus Binataceae bacterium]|nr:50S ribosomal protein L11 methyltransferase [Candidatus Binataceae bacterium]
MTSPKAKSYSSVAFEVPASMADEAAGILVGGGALGCEVGRPSPAKGIRGAQSPVVLRAYFERIKPATVTRLRATLASAGMLTKGAAPAVSKLTDPGWATMWQKRFAPLPVGERFLIVPPWRREREPRRIRIVIRPGQAFGTGHHPSTAGTLAAVEELCASGRFENALDVGTGSGILAIAMAKLGIGRVTAIDIDEVALANAQENLGLNRVSGRVRLSSTPLASISGRFRLITGNILSSTLIEMAPELISRMARGGHLVLAGILRREAESVVASYLPALTHVGASSQRNWTTLIFRR